MEKGTVNKVGGWHDGKSAGNRMVKAKDLLSEGAGGEKGWRVKCGGTEGTH